MVNVYYEHTKRNAGIISSSNSSSFGGYNTSEPITLEYLDEGNANVIYRIKTAKDDGHLPVLLRDKLLRLRKDKDFILTTQDQHVAFRQHVQPLFPAENLVQQDLVAVDEQSTKDLNAGLIRLEISGRRPQSRHGDVLSTNDVNGMLITDMTARPGDIFLELKPKWLVQSPTAPENAVRCRTCALRARRERMGGKRKTRSTPASFCPLALVSKQAADRKNAWQTVLAKNGSPLRAMDDHHETKVLPLLHALREHQIRLDPLGIASLEASKIPEEYLQATALRDCVLLIRITANDSGPGLEARLADLDLKHAHPHKVTQWRQTEISLISEGWYTNTEDHREPESVCLLSR